MKKSLILLLLLSTAKCYSQKITLALNLTQGNTYYMITSGKVEVNQNINGQQQDINTTIFAKISNKVISATDSTYVIEMRYEHISMQLAYPGKNIAFDSDKKDSQDIFSTIMATIINKPFSMVITKVGKIKSISNIENIYSGMSDAIPQLTDAQKLQLKEQLNKSFGENAIKANLEEAFALFPDVKVARNDKWVVKTKIEAMIFANVTTTFTLKDITDDANVIHGDAVVQSDNSADYIESNGFPMKFLNVTGTYSSDLKLDKKTGWITQAKIIKIIKADIDVKDNPKMPGGMKIPMTINGEISITDK